MVDGPETPALFVGGDVESDNRASIFIVERPTAADEEVRSGITKRQMHHVQFWIGGERAKHSASRRLYL
jgi:hypothetical protein